MTLLLIFIIFLTIIGTIQAYIHPSFTIRRGLSSRILIVSALDKRGISMGGAEPRIEVGPALQQADALPTKLRRTHTLSAISSVRTVR